MIPIFSSHYSIGKSILTLGNPNQDKQDGSSSIFSILQEQDMQELYLLENSLTGLPEALKNSEELGFKLRFGLLVKICEQEHKIAVFAKNSKGAKLLNKIYSLAYSGQECITESKLKEIWEPEDLMLCIPFYDSFIFKNMMSFDSCTPDLNELKPTFFIEKCGLPFDEVLESKVMQYCNQFKLNTQVVKSIYYNKKSDVKKLQTYKCICNRRFGKKSLSKPNLDHFGSDEFCFESYLEHKNL
jgi:DNA polymerase III alpha subunit